MQAFFAGVDYGDRPIRDDEVERERVEVAGKLAELEERLSGFHPVATGREFILIDDEDEQRTRSLKVKNGHGSNPAGTGRGYRDDPGSAEHVPNFSRGRYTWWDNVPGEDVFTYAPGVEGNFRVWISWGVHGSGVHTRDARYVLDQDGDLSTRDDQEEIARVDQYYFVGVTEGVSEKKPLWSGLHDAGAHALQATSRIILRGGDTGTGITADAILLEPAGGSESGGSPIPPGPALPIPVSPHAFQT